MITTTLRKQMKVTSSLTWERLRPRARARVTESNRVLPDGYMFGVWFAEADMTHCHSMTAHLWVWLGGSCALYLRMYVSLGPGSPFGWATRALVRQCTRVYCCFHFSSLDAMRHSTVPVWNKVTYHAFWPLISHPRLATLQPQAVAAHETFTICWEHQRPCHAIGVNFNGSGTFLPNCQHNITLSDMYIPSLLPLDPLALRE